MTCCFRNCKKMSMFSVRLSWRHVILKIGEKLLSENWTNWSKWFRNLEYVSSVTLDKKWSSQEKLCCKRKPDDLKSHTCLSKMSWKKQCKNQCRKKIPKKIEKHDPPDLFRETHFWQKSIKNNIQKAYQNQRRKSIEHYPKMRRTKIPKRRPKIY